MYMSEQVLNREMVHRDFGSVEVKFASLAGGGQEFLRLLAVLGRAQEQAAIEAQDVLSQADEALVLG
jgi:hypothetical protein